MSLKRIMTISKKTSHNFGGLAGMSTISDKKDLMQMPEFNKSYSLMERSLDLIKTTQNEIYYELHNELDELKLENKELKLKLVLLTNSNDILRNYPVIDPAILVKDQGIHIRLLGNQIKELNDLIDNESKKNKLLESKIQLQQDEILKLKQDQIFNTKQDHDEMNLKLENSNCPLPPISNPPNQSDTADIRLMNEKIIFNTKYTFNTYAFPSTIEECHSLIRSLIKSKDKLCTENKKLQNKLKMCQILSQKKEFMYVKNLLDQTINSFPKSVNNSNYKRSFTLPKLVNPNKGHFKNFH